MVVDAIHLKSGVTGVAPEDGSHTQIVRLFEGFGNLLQLTVAFGAAPVYSCAYGYGAGVPGAFYGAEQSLIIAIGQAEEFVVVELYDKGDAVGVFAAHDAQHTKGGGDGVTAGFDGQLYNILRVKIHGVCGKRGTAAMFDALVHREDRDVACVGQPSVAEEYLYISQYLVVPVGIDPDLLHMVG